MAVKEENQRVTITLEKSEINTLKVYAKSLKIHYTTLIRKIIKAHIKVIEEPEIENK